MAQKKDGVRPRQPHADDELATASVGCTEYTGLIEALSRAALAPARSNERSLPAFANLFDDEDGDGVNVSGRAASSQSASELPRCPVRPTPGQKASSVRRP